MQINNINNMQSSTVQSVKSAEENAEKENTEKIGEKLHGKDEYIPSEKDEPIGLYAVSQDDEGNKEIYYDAPNRSADNDEKAADSPQKAEDNKNGEKSDDKEKSESCTANTDKVDREIERLKKRLKELEQHTAAADGKERERIEKQIKAVESELAQKDNDTYRRQHTIFS